MPVKDIYRYRKAAALTLLAIVVAGTGILVALGRRGLVEADPYFPGAEVKYYATPLFSRPRLTVEIRDAEGNPLPTVLGLYVWAPNGSIVELETRMGRGRVELSYGLVKKAMAEWRAHLKRQGNNPDLVEPGILLLGAIHADSGVYPLLRAVTLDTAKIMGDLTITITITENITGKPPLIPRNKAGAKPAIPSKPAAKPGEPLQLPPGEVEETCYYYPGPEGTFVECYTWKLEQVLQSRLNTGLPLITTYIHGDVDKLNSVLLAEAFETRTSENLEVGFGITASVSSGSTTGSTSYEVPGFTVKLGGDRIWLNTYRRFIDGIDFADPAILSVGILGDAVLARYRLYGCFGLGGFGWISCEPLDNVSDMSMVRPAISNNQLTFWYEVDGDPDDGIGLAEQGFRAYKNNWQWSTLHSDLGGAFITSYSVQLEVATLPLFSASVNVFGIELGATVGLARQDLTVKLLVCNIVLEDNAVSDYVVLANYFYSPARFKYKDDYYPIGSMYIDAYVRPKYTRPR